MAQNLIATGANEVGRVRALLIQVNAALTGSFTVTQAGSTLYGTSSETVATITNPTVGSTYKYGGLQAGGITSVNVSATCDITVTPLDRLR